MFFFDSFENEKTPSAEPVWRNGRTYGSGPGGHALETGLSQLVFPQARKLLALLGDLASWECSLGRALTTVRLVARPSPLNCKNEKLLFALGEETGVQAIVSIVWAFL